MTNDVEFDYFAIIDADSLRTLSAWKTKGDALSALTTYIINNHGKEYSLQATWFGLHCPYPDLWAVGTYSVATGRLLVDNARLWSAHFIGAYGSPPSYGSEVQVRRFVRARSEAEARAAAKRGEGILI